MNLPPHQYISNQRDWQACLEKLKSQTRLAIDLEANSMYAYRERICLIQISIVNNQDYIIDPLAKLDFGGLGEIIQDPHIEKVFHAGEYDMILMKREYGWELNNLFDTMWAARILGYKRYGLASLLGKFYDVKLNKRYQKSNWCKRPLSDDQLRYAQLDTHYLLRLRDDLAAEISAAGREIEAQKIFAEQTQITLSDNSFSPDDFWSISGAYDLTRRQQAILKALNIYRDQEARKRDRPLFKIFSDRTLIQLAQQAPSNTQELQKVHGMSSGQIRRYGQRVLQIIAAAKNDPPPSYPKRSHRPPDEVVTRYEKLHNWRKLTGQSRGVESDVIISRDALWAIARENPQTAEQLAQIDRVGTWRCQRYGDEILDVLNGR